MSSKIVKNDDNASSERADTPRSMILTYKNYIK